VEIAEGSGGDVYILDRQPYNVRVFDPLGQHVRMNGQLFASLEDVNGDGLLRPGRPLVP
jgi:hypothetical protein